MRGRNPLELRPIEAETEFHAEMVIYNENLVRKHGKLKRETTNLDLTLESKEQIISQHRSAIKRAKRRGQYHRRRVRQLTEV